MTTSSDTVAVAQVPDWGPVIQALINHGSVSCEGTAAVAREMRAEFEERLSLRAGATQIRFARPSESATDPENYVLVTFDDAYRFVLVIGRRMVKEDTTNPALRSIVLRPILRLLLSETATDEDLFAEDEAEETPDEAATVAEPPVDPEPNADGWQTARNPLI